MKETEQKDICGLCPRMCKRGVTPGFCGAGCTPNTARIGLHMWEEPFISGERGSGTIFFTGCTLRCVYCQNCDISTSGTIGKPLDTPAFVRAMLDLESMGAHNINLVTPTPHIRAIVSAVPAAREAGLTVPIVYNTNSYMTQQALDLLSGLVDIYLADLKYVSTELSKKLSGAPDYFEHASRAIAAMYDQRGEAVFDPETGIMLSGVVIRHLVLPGHIDETRRVLDAIAERFGTDVFLSLMGQYIPAYRAAEYGELKRKLLRREYKRAVDYAISLGFRNLWVQETGSDDAGYVPRWEL